MCRSFNDITDDITDDNDLSDGHMVGGYMINCNEHMAMISLIQLLNGRSQRIF